VQYQLEQSQWWSPDKLLKNQHGQLGQLLSHTINNVPFYRERYQSAGLETDGDGLIKNWRELPILTRSDIQEIGDRLHSTAFPQSHGKAIKVQTSGSTGRPIQVLMTNITTFFWNAFALRDHLWHQRDPSGKLVSIRPDRKAPKDTGVTGENWGAPISHVFKTGPAAMLDSRTDIDRQVAWLQEQAPDYLLSLPSNILALAQEFQARSLSLPRLRQVRTFGETVRPELRRQCNESWGVPLVDMYTSIETGYIALQCPGHEHYHVQSENVLVEILDDDGQPCAPGEIGRVVVTTLHNFATPLIRYEIMDYAEVGEPCPCGRGLPVIKRVVGRERNIAVYPDGRRFYPSFPASAWADIAPIRQIQLIQSSPENINIRLVMERELN
jgi:phenylacetate-CoA ligase